MTTVAMAAAEIRKILKEKFPKIKFSVRSQNFSMGDSVNVNWDFGPTTKEVDEHIRHFQYGHFDGMQDIYENSNRIEGLPQTKWLHTERRYKTDNWEAGDTIYHKIGRDLAKLFNVEYNPSLYFTFVQGSNDDAKTYIYRILNKTSFPGNDITYLGIEETTSGIFFEDHFIIKTAETESLKGAA